MTQNTDQFVSREEYDNLKRNLVKSLDIIKRIIQNEIATNQGGDELMQDIQYLDNSIGDIERY